MTCEQASELLSDYVGGELDEFLCELVDRHVVGCARCRQQLDTYRRVASVLKEVCSEEPSPSYWERLNSIPERAAAGVQDGMATASLIQDRQPPDDVRPLRTSTADADSMVGRWVGSAASSLPKLNVAKTVANGTIAKADHAPKFLREHLYRAGPVMFPGSSVAQGAWQFGLLKELSDEVAEDLIETIAERAHKKLRPILTDDGLVIVCFGPPIHRCGMCLARKIASTRGIDLHVVMADNCFEPTLWCNLEELKNKHVIVFVDVVHSGGLLDRLFRVCQQAQPRQVSGLVVIDQGSQDRGAAPRCALWREALDERVPYEQYVLQAGAEEAATLPLFDPETCRTTTALPVEVATKEAAQEMVRACVQELGPILPVIRELAAIEPDGRVGDVTYPWKIDHLGLLHHATAGPEIVGRAVAQLRDLGTAGAWTLIYPAEQFKRARPWAKALQEKLGWPIVPIGTKDRKHYVGLSDEQARQLGSNKRAMVFDAVYRTGTTLKSLVHLLRGHDRSIVSEIAGFYLFDGSLQDSRLNVERELGIDIRSLFRLPLGPPTEPVRKYWRERMVATLEQLGEAGDASPNWAKTLREYCRHKVDGRGRRNASQSHDADAELRHAFAEAQDGARARLERAKTETRHRFVNLLDARFALREPKIRNMLHGFVCNSMPNRFVESCALALATQDEYSWFDSSWLILHRDLFTNVESKRWRFLAFIAYWIRRSANTATVDRVRDALTEFRLFREPCALFPDPTIEYRCSELLAILS